MGASTPSKRRWIVWADDEGRLDAEEYAEALLKAGTVLEMVGGVLMVGAERVKVPVDGGGDEFVTRAIVFDWKSFVPQPPREQQPPEQPSPEQPEAQPAASD